MKLLGELYNVITEKLAYGEHDWVLFRNSLHSSLKRQFFDLFEQGYSDREIVFELFHTEKAIAPYRNIKSEIKEALQDEILNFSPSNYHHSRFQRAYYQAFKQMAILKYLVGLGANKIVGDLGENLIKRAIYFELTDVVVNASRILFLYYGKKDIDHQKVKDFSAINSEYLDVLQLELRVEKVLSEITSLIHEGAKTKQYITGIAESYLESNQLPDSPFRSHRFYINYYSIIIYTSELKGDYEKAKDTAVEAYNHFCLKHYEHVSAKRFFLNQIIYAQLQLDCRNVSFEYVESTIELCRKGDVHWFDAHELKLRASLSSGKYDQAQESYSLMAAHHNFVHQPLQNRIRWTLFGIYVQFLSVTNLTSGKKPTTQYINKHFKFLEENRNNLKDMKVPYIIADLQQFRASS